MVTSDLIGFTASTLVLLTFLMKDMRRLRFVAVVSNIAFIAYGALAWLPPVLCLHIALLPLNLLRLWETSLLIRVESPDYRLTPLYGN